jgi:ATP-dependent exoDNAse (exonuclease V) alpha subunit
MVPTGELAQLVDHLRPVDVKLVLVGDHRHLRPIGAGGGFRGLLTRLPVIELKENRRQEAQWERDSLRLTREGAACKVVRRYDDVGRIDVGRDASDLRQRLVADSWAERDPGGSLMIAQRRVDVADLKGHAHR